MFWCGGELWLLRLVLCVLFGLDFGFIFRVLFGGGLWIGCGGLWAGIVRLHIIVFAC